MIAVRGPLTNKNSLTKLTNNPFGDKVETLNDHLQVLAKILFLNVGILHFHKKKKFEVNLFRAQNNKIRFCLFVYKTPFVCLY